MSDFNKASVFTIFFRKISKKLKIDWSPRQIVRLDEIMEKYEK